MNFQQMLSLHFPNTLTEAKFVKDSYQALNTYGFHGSNSIACVSVCRDEITYPLVNKIYQSWGEVFNFSGLAGMLFLGKAGFNAAHHHAPTIQGQERYVYFAMAHIAIDADGEIGRCQRPGQTETSGACGALMAFRNEMLNGQLNIELDPDDIEQSLLKHRLFPKIKYGDMPELIALTKMAYQTITEDLERIILQTVDPGHSDYAVLTGIQIHGSEDNYVWPGTLYAMVNGQRREVTL